MSDIILSVEHLTKYYPIRGWRQNRVVKALESISFDLRAGQTLAIVGESGSGKSTLARQLVGMEQPTSGKILINGIDVNDQTTRETKLSFKQIRMIFQNPFSSLNPHSRIANTLEEPLRINTNLSNNERKDAVNDALMRVGLRPEHGRHFPHMFSGGQRQRIAIARALMLDPKVIVADEPLSALDVSVQAQILNLLMDLQEDLKLSYVFISHDLGVVEHISDYVLVMYRGHLMEYGEVDQIFDSPKHPYTRTLLASTPTYRHTITKMDETPYTQYGKKKRTNHEGCVFAYRCPKAQEECFEQAPKTRHIAGQRVTCHWPLD